MICISASILVPPCLVTHGGPLKSSLCHPLPRCSLLCWPSTSHSILDSLEEMRHSSSVGPDIHHQHFFSYSLGPCQHSSLRFYQEKQKKSLYFLESSLSPWLNSFKLGRQGRGAWFLGLYEEAYLIWSSDLGTHCKRELSEKEWLKSRKARSIGRSYI